MDRHTYAQESLGLLSEEQLWENSPWHQMLSQGNQSPFKQKRKVQGNSWLLGGVLNLLFRGIFI